MAGHRNHGRPLGIFLAADIAKIRIFRFPNFRPDAFALRRDFFTLNRIQAFLKISDRPKLRPGALAFPRQLRFRQILRRQNDSPNPRFFHPQNHGQHAFHAAHVPLKGYLSNKTNFTKGIGVRVSHGAQNSHGNGQIQMTPVLADARRNQIHGHPPPGILETGVQEAGLDALPGFHHRGGCQPHNVDLRKSRADIRLHLHRNSFDALANCCIYYTYHFVLIFPPLLI